MDQPQADRDPALEQNPQGFWDESDVIYRYTREQAIEDGVLVDLSEWAEETGFKWPVACTRSVWQAWIEPPQGTESMGQSARGRAHDTLWMLFCTIKAQPSSTHQIDYEVLYLDRQLEQQTVALKAICSPEGPDGSPVITILLPHED